MDNLCFLICLVMIILWYCFLNSLFLSLSHKEIEDKNTPACKSMCSNKEIIELKSSLRENDPSTLMT